MVKSILRVLFSKSMLRYMFLSCQSLLLKTASLTEVSESTPMLMSVESDSAVCLLMMRKTSIVWNSEMGLPFRDNLSPDRL